MNKIGLFLFVVALLTVSCADKNVFILTGEVPNVVLDGKKVYLQELNADGSGVNTLDSTVIKNEKFVFKGVVKELPCINWVIIPDHPFNEGSHIFIIEAGNISMVIDTVLSVKGTPMNDRFNEFNTKQNKLNVELEDIGIEHARLQSLGEITPEKEAEFLSAFKENRQNGLNLLFEYTKENMTNPVGETFFRIIAGNLESTQQRELLALARPEFKKDENIQRLENQLSMLEPTEIGKRFVDLKAKTPNEQDIALSDYVGKGKVVLVDFWASWCGPCRTEMPYVVEAYKKYKNKDFEVVGVSLDKDITSWKNGIKDLNITWPQMSDLKFWDSELSAAYGVQSIPFTVLLDKDGTIIAKNLRGEELLLKLDELLNK